MRTITITIEDNNELHQTETRVNFGDPTKATKFENARLERIHAPLLLALATGSEVVVAGSAPMEELQKAGHAHVIAKRGQN